MKPAIELPKPDPNAAAVALLCLVSCVFSLFAPVCWAYANDRLRRIEKGEFSTAGRGVIVVARGVAVFITVLIAIVFACLLLVGLGSR